MFNNIISNLWVAFCIFLSKVGCFIFCSDFYYFVAYNYPKTSFVFFTVRRTRFHVARWRLQVLKHHTHIECALRIVPRELCSRSVQPITVAMRWYAPSAWIDVDNEAQWHFTPSIDLLRQASHTYPHRKIQGATAGVCVKWEPPWQLDGQLEQHHLAHGANFTGTRSQLADDIARVRNVMRDMTDSCRLGLELDWFRRSEVLSLGESQGMREITLCASSDRQRSYRYCMSPKFAEENSAEAHTALKVGRLRLTHTIGWKFNQLPKEESLNGSEPLAVCTYHCWWWWST